MPSALKVFLIAGEPSGDALGADLIQGLKANQEVAIKGVGGPLMGAQGLGSIFPMSDLSVVGIWDFR